MGIADGARADTSRGATRLARHLAAGEPVLHRSRLHASVLGWTATFAACVVGATALVVHRNALAPSTVAWLWAGALGVIVTSSLLPWLRWRAAELVVTPGRLLVRLSLRQVYQVELGSIERVTVQESPWGRWLGYGTVRVAQRGGGEHVFAGVAAPHPLRDALLRAARGSGARARR